ncbi:MAG: preprotein translocase subunit SecG [Pseudomonadota bacterium]
MLRTILTVLQVLSAFAIVGLVLLQRGKGADAGAGFGAGASGTVFGARGATTGLSRMTAIFAAIFMLNSLCLTYLFQRDARAQPASLLDKVAESAAEPAAAPAPTAPAPAPDANAVPVPAAPAEQAPPEAVKKP